MRLYYTGWVKGFLNSAFIVSFYCLTLAIKRNVKGHWRNLDDVSITLYQCGLRGQFTFTCGLQNGAYPSYYNFSSASSLGCLKRIIKQIAHVRAFFREDILAIPIMLTDLVQLYCFCTTVISREHSNYSNWPFAVLNPTYDINPDTGEGGYYYSKLRNLLCLIEFVVSVWWKWQLAA